MTKPAAPESDTPRTDDAQDYDGAVGANVMVVPAEFSRQLERELGGAMDALLELRETARTLDKLAERAENAEAQLAQAQARIAELEKVLSRIAKWFGEFPPTGDSWADGTPVSYGAAFGSNGERDFMRGIARAAIQAEKK